MRYTQPPRSLQKLKKSKLLLAPMEGLHFNWDRYNIIKLALRHNSREISQVKNLDSQLRLFGQAFISLEKLLSW